MIFEADLGTPAIQDDTIPLRGPNYKIDVKLNNSFRMYRWVWKNISSQ